MSDLISGLFLLLLQAIPLAAIVTPLVLIGCLISNNSKIRSADTAEEMRIVIKRKMIIEGVVLAVILGCFLFLFISLWQNDFSFM